MFRYAADRNGEEASYRYACLRAHAGAARLYPAYDIKLFIVTPIEINDVLSAKFTLWPQELRSIAVLS